MMKHLKPITKEDISKRASKINQLDLLYLSAKHDYLEGIKMSLSGHHYKSHRDWEWNIMMKAVYTAAKFNSYKVINLLLKILYDLYDEVIYDPYDDMFTVPAAEYDSYEVLKELHKNWFFIHIEKEKILRFALSSGSTRCTTYVIEDGLTQDTNDLMGNVVDFALWNYDLKNAKLLVEKGIKHDIKDQTIEVLVEEEKEEMLEFIQELGYGKKIQERREFIEYINRPL